ARAVAGVGRARIVVVGAPRPARLLRIGGTRGIRPVTGLGHVADARRRAALRIGVPGRATLALSAAAGVVDRARIAVVTRSGVVGVDAAQDRVAGVVGAGVAVVAVGRGARDAAVVHAGLGPGADVPVRTVPIAHAAAGDRRIHAAARASVGRRLAAVGRAHAPVIAARGCAAPAVPIRRV